MKSRREVTPEKLRGGFYTPLALVLACLERIRERLPEGELHLLEPSAGDGAFIRALGEQGWRSRVARITAIEPFELEAEKCRRALIDARLSGDVAVTSAIWWGANSTAVFDAAIGNPPFVRYQFISEADLAAIPKLGARMGVRFAGVSNLWIPVLLAALERLRPGGAFAFVIPTECLTGVSAAAVRRWLIDECGEVALDLFVPGSFPDVLQEVVILSGTRAAEPRTSDPVLPLQVEEHLRSGTRKWRCDVRTAASWTRYLLDPHHLEALELAQSLPLTTSLGDLVAFEVSIVTGANDFFSVDERTRVAFGLEPWGRPLLPRVRHAPG